MQQEVHNAEEMRQWAAGYIETLAPNTNATVVALSGELGAGKTTLAQAVAMALGVLGTVNSPTFVIEKIYSLAGQKWARLVHIDAYRLKSVDELIHLGWDGLIADPANLIVIEWPENVSKAIPENAHTIRIEIETGESRMISYGK